MSVLVHSNKRTTVLWNVDGGTLWGGKGERVEEGTLLSAQFCFEPGTAVKASLLV